MRKQIVPPFEAEYKCKVYTAQGVTLEQIALMRATRNNPRYSVMFIDDIGVDLAKKEGLIEQLPADQIPNMKRLLKRFSSEMSANNPRPPAAAALARETAASRRC